MGESVSLTLSNIFLGYHEKMWLNICPAYFKPSFYTRYMEDTLTLFDNIDHAHKLLDYLKEQHLSIKLTTELQKHSTLSFLDILVRKKR